MVYERSRLSNFAMNRNESVPKLAHKFYDSKKWAKMNTDVRTIARASHMDWMVDCARSFFSMMQKAVEAAPVVAEIPAGIEVDAATGIAKAPATPSRAETRAKAVNKAKPTVRTKVSTNLDDYEEDELKKAMVEASGGDIAIRLVEHARYLQSTFGSGWNSKSEMGIDSKEGLIAMQNSALSQNLRTLTYQFISMIRDACTHAQKERTRCSEALRQILYKPEYQDSLELDWVILLLEQWN